MARQMLEWMSSPENVIGLASVYLRIYFIGMPATMVYNFGSAILRAKGDTQRPLYFLLAAGVLNVVLNLFFVIVCRLDVAGVAMATSISQYVSAWLILRCLMREHGGAAPEPSPDALEQAGHRPDLSGGPARRLPGRHLLPVQCGDPVLHQLLRRHGNGGVRRSPEYRGLRLRGHERFLSERPDLQRAELWCRQNATAWTRWPSTARAL